MAAASRRTTRRVNPEAKDNSGGRKATGRSTSRSPRSRAKRTTTLNTRVTSASGSSNMTLAVVAAVAVLGVVGFFLISGKENQSNSTSGGKEIQAWGTHPGADTDFKWLDDQMPDLTRSVTQNSEADIMLKKAMEFFDKGSEEEGKLRNAYMERTVKICKKLSESPSVSEQIKKKAREFKYMAMKRKTF